MSIDKIINVFLAENSLFIKLYAGRKNYLHKTAHCKSAVRLVRLMIILILLLTHRDIKALHKLIDKLECILESSCTSYLKKHGKFIELRIIGNVGEVILACIILIGSKRKVESKSLTLDIKSRALNSTLSKGLVIPACSRLNTLIRQESVLKSGIVILNIRRALNESGRE